MFIQQNPHFYVCAREGDFRRICVCVTQFVLTQLSLLLLPLVPTFRMGSRDNSQLSNLPILFNHKHLSATPLGVIGAQGQFLATFRHDQINSQQDSTTKIVKREQVILRSCEVRVHFEDCTLLFLKRGPLSY